MPTIKQLNSQVTKLKKDLAAVKQNSTLVRRTQMARGLGKSFNGARNTYEVLGYPEEVVYQDLNNIYSREGLGTRIVDAVSDETWRENPLLIEGVNKTIDELDNPSQLQVEFAALADKHDLYTAFNDADAYCGISRFALIVLGLPGNWEEPAKYGKKLAYVSVHDEGSAEVLKTDMETDVENERFGLPNFYNVTLDDAIGSRKKIHYSRVVHIKEGRSNSRIYGVPRLLSMYDRLLDLEKVVGGGSEAFWLLIHRGMALSSKDGMEMPQVDTPAYAAMQDEIAEYEHGIRRIMRLVGMDVTDLGGGPVDSDAQFRTLIAYLSGASRIPQRILIGSEAGHLASSQDEYNFSNYIVSRQKKFAEPKILREFLAKCNDLGIIKVPKKYTVEWPSLFQLTELEKAQNAATVAGALATATNGAPELVMPPDEFAKRYLDYVATIPDPEDVLQPSPTAGVFYTPDEAPSILPLVDVTPLQPKAKNPVEVLQPKQGWLDFERIKAILSPKVVTHGGDGSGNFDHKGRPGEVGGSDDSTGVPAKGKTSTPTSASRTEDALKSMASNMGFDPKKIKFTNQIAGEKDGFSIAGKFIPSNPTRVWLNENENSVMVALRIPDNLRTELQAKYPFMDDETRDNLHITLCYIGDNRSLDFENISLTVQSWARASMPIKVNLQGLARFVSGGEIDPIVMTVDSPNFPEFRMNLTTMLDLRGIQYHKEHGFIPHMTLAYIGKDENLPIDTIEPLEINFASAYLVNGNGWFEMKLGEDVTQNGGEGSGNFGHKGRRGGVRLQ